MITEYTSLFFALIIIAIIGLLTIIANNLFRQFRHHRITLRLALKNAQEEKEHISPNEQIPAENRSISKNEIKNSNETEEISQKIFQEKDSTKEETVENIEEIEEINPEHDIETKKEIVETVENIEEIEEINPEHDIETKKENDVKKDNEIYISEMEISSLLKKVDQLIAQKNFEESKKLLIQILSWNEDHIGALERLSLLCLQLQDYGKAEVLYTRLIEEYPHDSTYQTNLALSYFHQKNFHQSIKHYQIAIEIDPQKPGRYANLGQVFFAIKDFEKAVECFRHCVKISPRNIEFLYLVADTYKHSKQLKSAKKWYLRILDLSPYDEEAKEEVRKLEILGVK